MIFDFKLIITLVILSIIFDITLFFHYSVLQITQRCKHYAVNFHYLFSVNVHKDVWNVNKFSSTLMMVQAMFLPERQVAHKVLNEKIGIAIKTPKVHSRE